MSDSGSRNRLTALHRAVDTETALIVKAVTNATAPLACRRGCADCCVDDLTVFGVEAELIRHHHAALLSKGTAHPEGACAFLGPRKECRIYAQRPYVCRTQGLPLRWQAVVDSGSAPVEMRDICPLNEPLLLTPLLELAPRDCWELGEYEGRLASLAAATENTFVAERVSLRSLFKIRG